MATLSETLNKFPPKFCRLLARKHHGTIPMSDREIAQKANLGLTTVFRLSKLSKWDGVKLGTIEAFTTACGVSLLCTSKHRRFLKHKKLVFMKNATQQQRNMFDRILGRTDQT